MMTYDDVLLCGCKMAAIGRILYLCACVLGVSCAEQPAFTFTLDGADWMLRDANGNVTNVAAEVPGQAHVDLMYVRRTARDLHAAHVCNVSMMTCFICCLEATFTLLYPCMHCRRAGIIGDPYCEFSVTNWNQTWPDLIKYGPVWMSRAFHN